MGVCICSDILLQLVEVRGLRGGAVDVRLLRVRGRLRVAVVVVAGFGDGLSTCRSCARLRGLCADCCAVVAQLVADKARRDRPKRKGDDDRGDPHDFAPNTHAYNVRM